MLKKLALLLLTAAILSLLNPAKVFAQEPGPSTMSFVMPAGVDPIRFDFAFDGQFFDIPGNTLLPAVQNGAGGAEFHVSPDLAGRIDFSQLKVTHDYAGGVFFLPTALPGFQPWDVSLDLVRPGTPVFLTAQQGSGRIGGPDGQLAHFFGLMVVDQINPDDVPALRASTFRVQAFVSPQDVPEPGMVALGVTALAGVAVPLLRRRRRMRA